MILFKDRVDAGKKLAQSLSYLKGKDLVVLGIPRGGIIVAKEVAVALDAPLDVVVTRKIEAPGEPEYALGAVTQDGDVIVDRQAAEALGATPSYIDNQIRIKKEEVRDRLQRLRGHAPLPNLEGKVVVIVDDGIATGSSVSAAVMSVRKRNPKEVLVAVPVAPRDAVQSLSDDGAKVLCLETPENFLAIGEFYGNFNQVEDLDVRRVLESASSERRG